MIDVKKLVTGFLILAVAASAAALLVSTIGANAGGGDGAGDAAANGGGSGGNAGLAIVGGTLGANGMASANGANGGTDSAFLPQAPAQDAINNVDTDDDGVDPALVSSTDAIMSDPNNLTGILANTYLSNLALTNPDGPATDANGNPTLTPPDSNSVIAQFVSSSTDANLQVPDWDAEADQVPVTITSSSPAALATYGSALDAILNNDIVQPDLQDMLSNNTDPSFEPYVEGKVQTALQDIAGLKTPTPAVALQKSLIKTLVYAKDSIALAANSNTDPLKTELVLEAEGTKYDAAVNDLQTQVQNAQAQNLFSMAATGTDQPSEIGSGGILASIQSLVGIPVAHAFLPVVAPASDIGIWATVAQMIKAEVKDVVLQIIKNTIVFAMQKTIFAAIKGSGAPAFIQQWGNTLANAFQTSALGALNSQMSCVGVAPFAAQLELTLGATYQPNKKICAVQFSAQLGNNLKQLNNFYNDFSSSGWLTYGATMQPDNNYYGATFFTAQVVANTAQNSQNAAQAKAIAGQGFHGSSVCADDSNPNGFTLQCQYPGSQILYTQSASCPSGSVSIGSFGNDGLCDNGEEPLVQTPGAIFNGMVGSAVNGNFSLITSANNWAGLASGLFVSIMQQVLNSLATSAISDAGGLLQQAANGGGATSVSGVGTNNPTVTQGASSPATVTCNEEPNLSSSDPLTVVLSVYSVPAVNGGSAASVTTPSYTWTPPTGGTLSATTGDTVTATFNATGTYQVVVNDFPDNASTTCQVTIPVPLQ
jgi:hypothetical protein